MEWENGTICSGEVGVASPKFMAKLKCPNRRSFAHHPQAEKRLGGPFAQDDSILFELKKCEGKGNCKGKGKGKGRSRFPGGMTERKARATANDKGNGQGNGQYRGLSTALRSCRDDGLFVRWGRCRGWVSFGTHS
jgi:hypothetical protein